MGFYDAKPLIFQPSRFHVHHKHPMPTSSEFRQPDQHLSQQEIINNRAAQYAITVGAVSNILLAGLKAVGGSITGSSALIADAVHSLADIMSDGVTYIAHRFARKPADSSFPFGRGKAESLGALVVSSSLILAGGHLGWDALQILLDLSQGKHPNALWIGESSHVNAESFLSNPVLGGIAAGGIVAVIGVKEGLYRWTLKLGHRMRSSVLIANAWHHRSDALSTIVAGAGVVGSLAGAPLLDPLAAVAVSGMIAKQGIELSWDATKELLDANSHKDLLRNVEESLKKIQDVSSFRQLRARSIGPYVHMDMEIGVKPNLTVSGADHIAYIVRKHILENNPQVTEVLINVYADASAGNVFCAEGKCVVIPMDKLPARKSFASSTKTQVKGPAPDTTGDEAATRLSSPSLFPSALESRVREIVKTVPNVSAITHLRVYYPMKGNGKEGRAANNYNNLVDGKFTDGEGVRVEMEVILNPVTLMKDAKSTVRKIRSLVGEIPGISTVDVHLEVDPV